VAETGDEPARDLHGLIRLAGLRVALPVGAIREVVPRPAALDPFPATRADVAGAMELRGQVIPVMDLAATLGAGAAVDAGEAQIVVIVRAGTCVFGMLAEAIDGVSALGEDVLGPLSLAGMAADSALFTASFSLDGRRGVVIDPAALGALPGLPMVDDRTAGREGRRALLEPSLIFTVGDLRCALPAGCVDASLPWQDMPPAPVDDPLWIAMLRYKGAEIPVIDTLALLGNGTLSPGRRSGAAVVVRAGDRIAADGTRAGHGLVALLIDTVDDIARLRPEQVLSLQHAGVPGSTLARGMVQATAQDGRACLLLDETRLVEDPRLVLLGAVEQRAVDAAQASATATAAGPVRGAVAERRPFLVFTLGEAAYAVPLDKVEAILPGVDDVIALPDGSCGVEGLFGHRGEAVPLIDLRRALHGGAAGESAFVVVTREESEGRVRRAGFRVSRLCSVERVSAQKVGNGAADAPAGLPGETIRLNDNRACTVLDLPALAARSLAAQAA
jgi:purine-binding chemotaxis protein CheW